MLNSRAYSREWPSRLTAVKPEVAILGADQKGRGLWGRECAVPMPKNGLCIKETQSAVVHAH